MFNLDDPHRVAHAEDKRLQRDPGKSRARRHGVDERPAKRASASTAVRCSVNLSCSFEIEYQLNIATRAAVPVEYTQMRCQKLQI